MANVNFFFQDFVPLYFLPWNLSRSFFSLIGDVLLFLSRLDIFTFISNQEHHSKIFSLSSLKKYIYIYCNIHPWKISAVTHSVRNIKHYIYVQDYKVVFTFLLEHFRWIFLFHFFLCRCEWMINICVDCYLLLMTITIRWRQILDTPSYIFSDIYQIRPVYFHVNMYIFKYFYKDTLYISLSDEYFRRNIFSIIQLEEILIFVSCSIETIFFFFFIQKKKAFSFVLQWQTILKSAFGFFIFFLRYILSSAFNVKTLPSEYIYFSISWSGNISFSAYCFDFFLKLCLNIYFMATSIPK